MTLQEKGRFIYLHLVNFAAEYFFKFLYKCGYRKKAFTGKVERILIIRLDKLGDVILTLPAMKALRDAYPEAKITILINKNHAEALKGQDVADEILAADIPWNREGFKGACVKDVLRLGWRLRRYRFDLAVDFRGDSRCVSIAYLAKAKKIVSHTSEILKSGRYGSIKKYKFLIDVEAVIETAEPAHPIDMNFDVIKAMGIQEKKEFVRFDTSASDEKYIVELFKQLDIAPRQYKIVLHPGAGLPRKLWPVGRYAILAVELSRICNARIFITGTEQERKLQEGILALTGNVRVTGLAGKLTLGQLSALLKKADLLVLSDSGIVHLASLCGTPVIGLYGPSSPALWRPYDRQRSGVLVKAGPCRACPVLKECDFRPTTRCMDKIQYEDVLQASGQFLSG